MTAMLQRFVVFVYKLYWKGCFHQNNALSLVSVHIDVVYAGETSWIFHLNKYSIRHWSQLGRFWRTRRSVARLTPLRPLYRFKKKKEQFCQIRPFFHVKSVSLQGLRLVNCRCFPEPTSTILSSLAERTMLGFFIGLPNFTSPICSLNCSNVPSARLSDSAKSRFFEVFLWRNLNVLW